MQLLSQAAILEEIFAWNCHGSDVVAVADVVRGSVVDDVVVVVVVDAATGVVRAMVFVATVSTLLFILKRRKIRF